MKYKVIFKIGSARATTIVDSKKAAEELGKKLGNRFVRIEEYAG